ncbi:hypothetical protein NQZ68_013676 [Dissostichus eleginoides]|nr:hypothetical protein NQZ68_013676 [Dissostichus eleginoides]
MRFLQRRQRGQGQGTETDDDKQHLVGNNYLCLPTTASCGRSSHNGCQFAARLSPNQRLSEWEGELEEGGVTTSSLMVLVRLTGRSPSAGAWKRDDDRPQ